MGKERPILFSGPMVRAILEGRKTQTRRIVKPQPDENGLSFMPNAPLDWRDDVHGDWNPWKGETPDGDTWRGRVQCWPGDRLWVRETWMRSPNAHLGMPPIEYKATSSNQFIEEWPGYWKPSIHMPRWASRINLAVVSVRVERLQDCSITDALAEGIVTDDEWPVDPRDSYRSLWESINGPGSWDANPWVWVIEFKRIKP